MTYEDNKDWIHDSVRDWVRGGVSVVARDKTSNEIVGTVLGTILTRNQSTSFDEALDALVLSFPVSPAATHSSIKSSRS